MNETQKEHDMLYVSTSSITAMKKTKSDLESAPYKLFVYTNNGCFSSLFADEESCEKVIQLILLSTPDRYGWVSLPEASDYK